MALRFDSCSWTKAQRRDNGTLLAPATLTRVGVFVYRRADGTERRELRPPEEVFNVDSLASFSFVPVTEDLGGLGGGHPREGAVSAGNAKRVIVGSVGEGVHQAGNFVDATLVIHDPETIARIEAGKVALSCGYSAECEETPGVWQGERYDSIQRNIRGNHVAVVDAGRAGPEARIRLDSADAAEQVCAEPGVQWNQSKSTDNGAQSMTPEIVAMQAELAAAVARADAADAELAKVSAKFDDADKRLAELTLAHADAVAPSKVAELVRARIALETRAASLASGIKCDGLSDSGVKLAVISARDSGFVAEGKSDAYVDARFDLLTPATSPEIVRVDAAAVEPMDRAAAFRNAVAKKFLPVS